MLYLRTEMVLQSLCGTIKSFSSKQGLIKRILLVHMLEEATARKKDCSILPGGCIMLIQKIYHPLKFTCQQIIFIEVVLVKRGTSNIGTIQDILDRDVIVALLPHE